MALVVEGAEGYAALSEHAFNRLEKISLLRDARGYGVLDYGQRLTYRFGLAEAVRALAAVENANDVTIRFAYDEQGHLTTVVDSAGRVLAVACDEAGRILTISTAHPTEPKQRVTLVTYRYNERGELVRVTYALGQAAGYHYQDCNEEIKPAMEDAKLLGFMFYTLEEYAAMQIAWKKRFSAAS